MDISNDHSVASLQVGCILYHGKGHCHLGGICILMRYLFCLVLFNIRLCDLASCEEYTLVTFSVIIVLTDAKRKTKVKRTQLADAFFAIHHIALNKSTLQAICIPLFK